MEVAECLRLYRKSREMDEQEAATKEQLGVGHDGWVPNERHEKATILNAENDVRRFIRPK
jgi:hypothetical protein